MINSFLEFNIGTQIDRCNLNAIMRIRLSSSILCYVRMSLKLNSFHWTVYTAVQKSSPFGPRFKLRPALCIRSKARTSWGRPFDATALARRHKNINAGIRKFRAREILAVCRCTCTCTRCTMHRLQLHSGNRFSTFFRKYLLFSLSLHYRVWRFDER